MDNQPSERYVYPAESEGELRARLLLHEISAMLGKVRTFSPIKLPGSMFGERAKKILGAEENDELITVTSYERHDIAVWQHDTGDEPGCYGITLIERDRYSSDEPVEPIRVSMELKSSIGNLNISAALPSRHFSDIDWPRSEEEVSPPKIIIDSWQTEENTSLKDIAGKFLMETSSEDVEKFKYLLHILDGQNVKDRLELGPDGLIHIARFFEKFWRGETIEEMDS